jgi:hypothetical protein
VSGGAVRDLATLGLLAAGAAGIVACASAVNLDVQYADVASGDAGPDAEPDSGPVMTPPSGASELEACPCDQSQGLSCCVSAVGPAFCTTDRARCESEQGAFYGCFGPDLTTESVCCWHGTGALALTAFAAVCTAPSVAACTSSVACGAGVECTVVDCGGVRIGGCGQAPTCPPGTAR